MRFSLQRPSSRKDFKTRCSEAMDALWGVAEGGLFHENCQKKLVDYNCNNSQNGWTALIFLHILDPLTIIFGKIIPYPLPVNLWLLSQSRNGWIFMSVLRAVHFLSMLGIAKRWIMIKTRVLLTGKKLLANDLLKFTNKFSSI